MKKLLKLFIEILILLSVIALTFGLIEWRYKSYKTPIDIVMKNFNDTKKTAEILLVGNSHIIPLSVYLKKYSADNAHYTTIGFGGIDLFWESVFLKKYMDSIPHLKSIVFSVDEELMGYNQSFFKQEYTNRSFFKYTDTLYKITLSDRWLSKSNFFRSNRNAEYLFSEQKVPPMNDLFVAPKTETPLRCRQRAKEQTEFRFNPDLIAENKTILKETIARIKKSGVAITFVILPKKECFKENRNKKNIEIGRNALSSVMNEMNVQLMDYSTQTYPDSLFRDADHLNMRGSQLLWSKISEKLGLEK